VILQGDGQILCDLDGCSIHIRFDKGPVRTFPAAEAADHSTNILFIRRTSSFVKSLKKSSNAVVELNFYQNGIQELSFDTAKLVWK
jgi:hypothetical protein